jgi:glycerol uptake facilitator-like aquaporin
MLYPTVIYALQPSPFPLPFGVEGYHYYGKVIWMEILLTFTFTVVFLMSKYKPSLQGTDEIIKGIGVAIVMFNCYALSAGSGGSLNPALGLT